jgi:hypothetical protein
MLARCRLSLLLLAAVVLSAQTSYALDVPGLTVDFLGITETSSSGDALPLFGTPTGAGDTLTFSPTFSASASAGGFDITQSQLQLVIQTSVLGATILQVKIDELGSTTLGGTGTAGTGSFVGVGGSLLITHTTGGALGVPVSIPITGTITAGGTFTLPTNPGMTPWTGSVVIDVASIVPDATRAVLAFDNDMFASSEAGSDASIQKDYVKITVIPEPGTAALCGVGLLLLSLHRRGRRA